MALLDESGLKYLWSQLKTKFAAKNHTHTKAEVGLGNVDNTADNAKSVKAATKLQTYKQGSTTETYGDSYPLYAQWSGNDVILKCDNYKVWADRASVSNSANAVAWANVTGKPSTYTPSNHTHTKSQITDFPTSLPASDVYAWAKASAKPSYSWSEITGKPSTFTPSGHSHNTFGKATTDAAGSAGFVPAPAKGQQGQYLRGDGTWATPTNTTYGAASQSTAGLMSAADKTKLNGIAEKANNYSHPTSAGNKHIPAGGSAGKILGWASDGTAQWVDDKNTTYSNFKGATSSAAGGSGLVPAPAAGGQGTQYLRADGVWAVPPNTTYANATQGAAGLMSGGDKTKLDGIAVNANNYVHPTTSGNKHIPAGGASGQILRWSADGTATWGADKDTTYTNFVGATANASGKAGLVPAPSTGATNLFLRSDGTWGSVAGAQTSITIVRW